MAAIALSSLPAEVEAGNLFCDSAGWLRCDNGAFYGVLCSNYCKQSQCDDGRASTTDSCSPQGTSPPLPRGQGCNAARGACPLICTYSSCPSGKLDLNDNPSDGCEVDIIDFALAPNPSSGTANKGESTQADIAISLSKGSGSVSLKASVPADVEALFAPESCSAPCSSKMTLKASKSAPVGVHEITIYGTSQSVTKTAKYSLTVTDITGEEAWRRCGTMVVGEPLEVKSASKSVRTTGGKAVEFEIEIDATKCRDMDVEIFLKKAPPEGWGYSFECGFCSKQGRTAVIKASELGTKKTSKLVLTVPITSSPGSYQMSVGGRKVS